MHTASLHPLLLVLTFTFAISETGRTAVILVDTFDQGGFSIFRPGGNPSDEMVNLPLGTQRGAELSGWASSPGSTMTSTLNSSTGKLNFIASGTATNPTFPMSLSLVYGGPDLHSIAGCTEFILGFSELSGVGTLYIELGGSNGFTGVLRVDLTGPGELHYPVTGVYEGAGHTLDSFNVLTFKFESRSSQFSFTLDEIRLIPEPSASVLALAAGAGLLAWRRRK